jgi:Activator of Hsp90 ATPase homolog 1-like protein
MTAVRLGTEVAGDALEAFDRFTAAMRERWPEVGLEPHAGGPVKLWRPGNRLEIEWREPAWPQGLLTSLAVSFESAGRRTRISLEHAGLEQLGDEIRRRYETDWSALLESLRPAAEG